MNSRRWRRRHGAPGLRCRLLSACELVVADTRRLPANAASPSVGTHLDRRQCFVPTAWTQASHDSAFPGRPRRRRTTLTSGGYGRTGDQMLVRTCCARRAGPAPGAVPERTPQGAITGRERFVHQCDAQLHTGSPASARATFIGLAEPPPAILIVNGGRLDIVPYLIGPPPPLRSASVLPSPPLPRHATATAASPRRTAKQLSPVRRPSGLHRPWLNYRAGLSTPVLSSRRSRRTCRRTLS